MVSKATVQSLSRINRRCISVSLNCICRYKNRQVYAFGLEMLAIIQLFAAVIDGLFRLPEVYSNSG